MDTQPSSQQPRVTFRNPEEEEEEEKEENGEEEEEEEEKKEEEEEEEEEEERPPQRRLGKLTLKYNRRDLQRRLDMELWMETQLQWLFDCDQEDEELPELQVDVDALLDLSDSEQRSRLNTLLQRCEKPTEDFINGLLDRIKGLCKMSAQQRK